MKRYDLLRSPLLLLAVALLLLNDLVLKAVLHNWLTGKLSDFAGLAAFTIFFCAIWPRQVWRVGGCVAVFFVFWKSPYSQGLIDFANTVAPFPVGRTVDYSDLIALPVVWLVCRNVDRLPVLALGRVGVWLTAGLCLFAFTATSYMDSYRPSTSFDIAEPPNQAVSETDLQSLFDRIAEQYGMQCSSCRSISVGRFYFGGPSHLGLEASFDSQRRRVYFGVTALSTSKEDSRKRRPQADQLKAEIERALRDRFPTITFSEWREWPLSPAVVEVTPLLRADDADRAVAIIDDFMRAKGFKNNEKTPVSFRMGPMVGPSEWALMAAGGPSKPTGGPFGAYLNIYAGSADYTAPQRQIAEGLAERLRAEFGSELVRIR